MDEHLGNHPHLVVLKKSQIEFQILMSPEGFVKTVDVNQGFFPVHRGAGVKVMLAILELQNLKCQVAFEVPFRIFFQ